MKAFQRTVLKNGLRVILVPENESLATTVLVLVEAGSKYETKDISGLSHFLEHMVFKGTNKRPTALDIAGELDGMGAEYNAFTSQEYTGYFAKVAPKHTRRALDIIADMYLNPTFDKKEIEKEKGVIIEEINMYEDMPMRNVHDLFMHLLYGDQPAGWDVAGRKEVIRKLTREDFVTYRGKHYLADATTLVIAGNFNGKTIGKKIQSYFDDMPAGKKQGKKKVIERQSKPEIALKNKKSDQSHLVLGVRAFAANDKRRYTLQVLADILGGGMSSRLFQKVRDELGAAYYIRAGVDLLTDHGMLTVSSGVQHGKLMTVVKAILREMECLVKERVTDEELTRAKDHLSGRLTLSLETSDALATYYGGQEILHETLTSPRAIVSHVNAVTAKDIQSLARTLMKNNKLNLALIGPYKDKDKSELKHILKFIH
jgi:predicted Zn-dependent peptidase